MENIMKNIKEKLQITAVIIAIESIFLGIYYGFGLSEWYDKIWSHFGFSYSEYVQWWYGSEWRTMLSVACSGIGLAIFIDVIQFGIREYRKEKNNEN